MEKQLEMAEILGDEKPEKPEPAAPTAPAEPAAAEPDAAAKEAADEQRKEDYKSKRNKARDKESEAQGKVRDPDTGQFVSPKEATAAPAAAVPAKPAAPKQELTEKEKAFLRAAQEERGKRQEWERRVASGEYVKAGAPPAAPAAPAGAEAAKTFWDDPEAALARDRTERQQEALTSRIQMAEFIARQKHPDFDEKVAVFGELLKATPGLYQQWISQPDLAEYAYSVSKNHIQLRDAGSVEALTAKIEKETRVKLEAELREKADALAKERAALPPSLSEARSTGVNKPAWGGVPSMDEILK